MTTTSRDSAELSASSLEPPRGYRPLAWLGLIANILAILLGLAVVLTDHHWRTIHIAVGAGGLLPTAIVGIIASVALLRWRHWGVVLAIVALSMALAVSLPYGIVRLVLRPESGWLLAAASFLLWAATIGALLFWCRPAVRRYLR